MPKHTEKRFSHFQTPFLERVASRPPITVAKSAYHHQSHTEIASDNPGGLKGSMQHWLAVYPPEFQIPMFFVAVD
jgi:hypothetical protein